MKARLLLTGTSGILGSNLAYCWRDKYNIIGLYNTRPVVIEGIKTAAVDILDRTGLKKIIQDFSPDIIVHAAALADVDLCETQKDLAQKMNVEGTRHVVEASKSLGVKMVHISTDLVYDGVKGNFSENDPVAPPNHYAATKLASESIVREVCPAGLVLRTNFFGWSLGGKRSLPEWLLDELHAARPVKGFTDAIFSSIYTFDMAAIITEMINAGLCGIYNVGSSTSLSKYDFLVAIARQLGLNADLISPARLADRPAAASRSKNLSMNVEKLQKVLPGLLPKFEESITHFVQDLKSGKKSELMEAL